MSAAGPWYAPRTKPPADKLARDRAYYYADHERRKRASLDRYHARRLAGVCTACAKVPPRQGMSECASCAEKRSERRRAC